MTPSWKFWTGSESKRWVHKPLKGQSNLQSQKPNRQSRWLCDIMWEFMFITHQIYPYQMMQSHVVMSSGLSKIWACSPSQSKPCIAKPQFGDVLQGFTQSTVLFAHVCCQMSLLVVNLQNSKSGVFQDLSAIGCVPRESFDMFWPMASQLLCLTWWMWKTSIAKKLRMTSSQILLGILIRYINDSLYQSLFI